MNKNGQVLVTFILLLPLIIMFLGFIFDVGSYYYESKKIENVLNDVINYSIENKETLTEAKIEEIINENISNYKTLSINLTEEDIKIKIVKENQSVFNILDVGFNQIEFNIAGNFLTKEITRK